MAINYFDEIIKRASSRNFADTPVSDDDLKALAEFFDKCPRLDKDIELSMIFTDADTKDKVGKNAGYHGFMIAAPKYMLIFSEKKEHYIENAGFVAQAMTLKMTELGLSACWATINDADAIKDAIAPGEDKALTVIVAFGHKGEDDKDVRLDIKSPSNVKMVKRENAAAPKISVDDLVSYKAFGQKVARESVYEDLENALLAVSVAQSFFNRQPYRLILNEDSVYLIGIEDEMTSAEDTLLNYGIAMFNFASVLGDRRASAPSRSFDKPAEDVKLPEGHKYIAKCGL